MKEDDAIQIYQRIKEGSNCIKFKEDKHCPLLIKVMKDRNKGRISSFCVEAEISEDKFYYWVKQYPIFKECYSLGKMYAREEWEKYGAEIKDEDLMPGTTNNKFEYWKMIGWTRFGVGKTSRIRLDLNASDTPDKHYAQLLQQASEGDFTAGEVKQLMEAINVGLNTHQVFMLQKEIDQLKADLITMTENSNGNNTFTDQGITKKD